MSRVVALVGSRARLVVRGEALHAEKDGALVGAVPTHEIEAVHLYGRADLSAEARNLLLREGIDVVFLTLDGRYRGRLVGVESRRGERRLAQYRFIDDPARRLGLAGRVVAAKIANQRAVLVRRQEKVRDEAVSDALAALRGLEERARAAPHLDALRGVEGLAASLYFGAFGRVIADPRFPFAGRTRYPPRDPVNALLSYGYALLLVRVDAAVRAAGLDAHLGVLHEAGRGAPALALDLMEELRPAVDAVVLALLNLRQLDPGDFREPDPEELGERAELAEGACFLGPTARAVLLRAWERRLEDRLTHPTQGGRWALRDLIVEQARQLARLVDGETDTWRPLDLRS